MSPCLKMFVPDFVPGSLQLSYLHYTTMVSNTYDYFVSVLFRQANGDFLMARVQKSIYTFARNVTICCTQGLTPIVGSWCLLVVFARSTKREKIRVFIAMTC